MKLSFIIALSCLAGACAELPAGQEASARQVYKIMFQERAIGRVIQEEFRTENVIRLVETLEFKTQFRGMNPVVARIVETQEESLDGSLLRFRKDFHLKNAQRTVRAEARNNIGVWREFRGEKEQVVTAPLPANFMMPYSLRQQMKSRLKLGEKLSFSRWNENTMYEMVELGVVAFDSIRHAWKISEEYPAPSQKKPAEYWVDDNFQAVDNRFLLFGQVF